MTESQEELERIFKLAHHGDREAIGQILENYRSYLKLLARIQIGLRLQAKVDPDDVVQEVFLDANRQIMHFRGESLDAFTAWLRKLLAGQLAQVIRRYCGTEARDVRLERSIEQDLDSSSARLAQGLASPTSSPSESFRRREDLVDLAHMLEQLPADYRSVILMRQIDGLSFVDISMRLDRSQDSVQKLWVRGLQALKALMDPPAK